MRRTVWLLLILSLVLAGFYLANKKLSSAQAPQKTTLTFWTLQLSPFKNYIEEMIATYEKQHPLITINWVDVPFSEGEKRALTAMLSPNVPDVINLNPAFSATLAQRKTLLNLNNYLTAAQKKHYLNAVWQSSSINNQPFGIPWYLSSQVLFYNKTILNEAGVFSPPRALADLPQMAKQIKLKTKAFLLMPSLSDKGQFLTELSLAGVAIKNKQGQAIFANNPAATKQLQLWVNLYQNQQIPPESLTGNHREALDKYQSGQLALLPAGVTLFNLVKSNAPAIYRQSRVSSQFPANQKAVNFATMLLIVPAKSKHPKEAVDFAVFVTNATNQLALARLAPVLPSAKEALAAPEFSNCVQKTDLIEEARCLSAQQLLSAQQGIAPLPNQSDWNEAMDEAVQKAMLGQLSAEAALRQAQEKINAQL